MKAEYKSKYGKIVKQCPGINEYWYKGKLIARAVQSLQRIRAKSQRNQIGNTVLG